LVLDKYLEVTDLAESTLATCENYFQRVIRPVLADKAGRTAAESFWWCAGEVPPRRLPAGG
jgi:hypothetical protein